MTREEARAAAQVLLAFADGQPVQSRNKQCYPGDWVDDDSPTFSMSHRDYRIKPKLRQWWVLLQGNGRVWGTFNSQEEAKKESQINDQIIKVREVIE